MTTEKPFSPSCERNRGPILEVLREQLADRHQVLELGSGTGQHAVYFAAALPHLFWQCSDRAANLPAIRMWLDEARLPNTPQPLTLDVSVDPWPQAKFDAVFCANTIHIMSWAEVELLFRDLANVLADDSRLILYGPFKYGGEHTSASNATFNDWLLTQGAHMGIRDFEAVDALAQRIGLRLIEDYAMPANNRCLIWQRGGPT
ncbi:MAG: class I SAM-dependent methyltransferase [Pseudomonadota bacterium]|nr:class I SAM-dependent methyltransferase [Pseudomonadota bacterium]